MRPQRDTQSYHQWWRRKISATKTIPTSTISIKKPQYFSITETRSEKSKKTPVEENEFGRERKMVITTMKMFRDKCKEISVSRGTRKRFNGVKRIDSIAKEALKKQGKLCISSSKILGPIPGVHIGDRFEYRMELTIVGLHGRNENGIDYMEHPKIFNKTVATCVVAKEGCKDEINDNDEVITYIGEGGIVRNRQRDCPKDQKLPGGNLAMMNSFFINNDVRVVRGIKVAPNKTAYIYDGLYKVISYEEEIEPAGNLIFVFELQRCDGQTVVPWNQLKSNASFGMFC